MQKERCSSSSDKTDPRSQLQSIDFHSYYPPIKMQSTSIDKTDPRKQLQSIDLNSFYPQMYPMSNSISPSDQSSIDDDSPTENNLNLALEYQQLYNRYSLCLSHLTDAHKQIDFLRLTNADLVKRLTLMSQGTFQNYLADDFSRLGLEENVYHPGNSPRSVIEKDNNQFGMMQHQQRGNGKERVTMPKSISVRSSGYMPPHRGVPTRGHRSVNSVKTSASPPAAQRVCVPGAGGEKESSSLEFEVFNQGMFKTELCNKWQETGACPYGDNCQFAHGITELRPIIRHPRYKTEVCRMVLAGDSCPYGHRCHFRHSLTPEEKMLCPLRLNEN